MERRHFLRIVAGAATMAGGFLFPGLPILASKTQTLATSGRVSRTHRDPNFEVGRVLAAAEAGAVLLVPEGQRAIRFDSSSVIWKETVVTPAAIELDDYLYVSGTAQPDGSLLARRVHANITRFDGVIKDINGTGLALDTLRGEPRR